MTRTSHLAAEIATQPDDWAAVLGRLDEALAVLPRRGGSVAVVGCGTSFFMAQAYAALRESAGHGRTEAHAASEFPAGRDVRPGRGHLALGHHDRGDRAARPTCASAGQRTTAIVATEGTAIPALATESLMLPEVDEQSVVQTRFATTTLALLRASLGEDLTAAIADARAVLAEDEDSALGRPGRRRADHLRRPRLDHRPGQRGRPQAARVGAVLDRVLPRHGVPPRPDQHRHRRAARPGPSARCPRDSPRTSGRPARTSSTATSTRWPTSCACTACAWRRRRARESTQIAPGT